MRPAKMDDVEAVAALLNAYAIEQIGRAQFEADAIRSRWQSPHFNVETDSRVVIAPDGKLVGHGGVWDVQPHVRIYGGGRVHPEYKGQGIGTTLSRWVEERARQAIPKASEGARVVLLQETLSTDTAAQELLRKQGYRLVRHAFRMVIEMDAPPPEPVVPEGLTLRPFVRGQEERAVILAVREAFKDAWGFVEHPFEDEYKEWMHRIDNDPDYDPSLWFVANGVKLFASGIGHVVHYPEKKPKGRVVYHEETARGVSPTGKS